MIYDIDYFTKCYFCVISRSTKVEINDLTVESVRLQMLAAPINPADINTIQGDVMFQKFMYKLVLPSNICVANFQGHSQGEARGLSPLSQKPSPSLSPANEMTLYTGSIIDSMPSWRARATTLSPGQPLFSPLTAPQFKVWLCRGVFLETLGALDPWVTKRAPKKKKKERERKEIN